MLILIRSLFKNLRTSQRAGAKRFDTKNLRMGFHLAW